MKDLIAALTILGKYMEETYSPTNCEHDILYVSGVDPNNVSPEDLLRLEELGFDPDDETGVGFYSFRFGSSSC